MRCEVSNVRRVYSIAMRIVMALVAMLVVGGGSAWAEWLPAAEIQPRVEHHIREVDVLVEHFETFVAGECPRFSTSAAWEAYAEGEIDRMLLLAAHAEQAWAEAKRTGDDDVRRAAKAPRRRLDEAPKILNKLSACAEDNGVTLSPGSVYRRLERDLPRRQSEISLPR
jgi:hypothetical protein